MIERRFEGAVASRRPGAARRPTQCLQLMDDDLSRGSQEDLEADALVTDERETQVAHSHDGINEAELTGPDVLHGGDDGSRKAAEIREDRREEITGEED